MEINEIVIKSEGYIYCKSKFYSACDSLQSYSSYTFSQGINKLLGEIDSGNWAASYLLSMYNHRAKDFVLFDDPIVFVNDQKLPLKDISKFTCYMDNLDPLFLTKASIKQMVKKGLTRSRLGFSCDDIKEMFSIDDERFERPISGAGNEIFKALGAIGVAFNKEIFCFPWLSNRRYAYYHKNLTIVLQALEDLRKIVILPLGPS